MPPINAASMTSADLTPGQNTLAGYSSAEGQYGMQSQRRFGSYLNDLINQEHNQREQQFRDAIRQRHRQMAADLTGLVANIALPGIGGAVGGAAGGFLRAAAPGLSQVAGGLAGGGTAGPSPLFQLAGQVPGAVGQYQDFMKAKNDLDLSRNPQFMSSRGYEPESQVDRNTYVWNRRNP